MLLPKILLSGNPTLLEEALKEEDLTITIEAEYGDRLVRGNYLTLAHHGLRRKNPCPCVIYLNTDHLKDKYLVFGLSHVDLDSLLALFRISPGYKFPQSFLEFAAFVDVNGIHKIPKANPSKEDLEKYYACECYIQKLRPKIPKDSVSDISAEIRSLFTAFYNIFSNEQEWIKDGEEFRKSLEHLNEDSFIDKIGDVIVRVHSDFVNHLYITPNGEEAKAIVAFKPPVGTISVSFADPIPDLSCREIVQELWGEEAGGHDGIAGSPRGKRMKFRDFENLINKVVAQISILD